MIHAWERMERIKPAYDGGRKKELLKPMHLHFPVFEQPTGLGETVLWLLNTYFGPGPSQKPSLDTDGSLIGL